MSTVYEEQEQSEEVSADADIFSGDLPFDEALRRLRLRLLDLTGRNKLLNFKHSIGKSLQFVHSSPEAIFARLYQNGSNAGCQISPVPEPPRAAWAIVSGRLTKPDAKQHADSLGLSTSYELPIFSRKAPVSSNSGHKIQTLYYLEDLGKHCRKLDREARLAIQETGANMLYLVFGFLEYPDAPASDKLYRAPLVCLPVRFEKAQNGPYTTFSLVYTGEELTDNLSLREKVNRDFGLLLPKLDEDHTLSDYFDRVEAVIEEHHQWRLRRMMSLTLLSFSNMLLFRDLDPDNWASGLGSYNRLLHHPIVRRIFQGAPHPKGAEYGEEYAVDEHQHAQLPLVYDADSSQHSALIDVIEGRNLVIEGPPGTGKSQTITNLIASALHIGKKVLFVSEKLAALEVVKARLANAGLENFILELHSNKTNKKRVIENIEKRKRFQPSAPPDLDSLLESLEKKHKELKAYADLLNSIQGNNQNLTVHKVLWRTEKFRARIGEYAELVRAISVVAAPEITTSRFHAQYELLGYIAKTYDEIASYDDSHPFWGFFPEEILPGQDLIIQTLLRSFANKFRTFANAMRDTAQLLGGPQLNMSSASASSLINVLVTLAPADAEGVAFDLLPKIFPAEDPDASLTGQVIEDLQLRLKELQQLHDITSGRWLSPDHATAEHLREAQRFQSAVNALNAEGIVSCNLVGKIEALSNAAKSAIQGLCQLEIAAQTAGAEFDSTPAAIEKLKLLLSLAESAPDDLLYLRHEGFRRPQATSALTAANNALVEIKTKRDTLETDLYLDLMPSETELKDAILVLREGDAWYRIFQGKWRKATGLHKQLQRVKEKKSIPARLAQLEEVLSVMQLYESWRTDSEMHSVVGASYKDAETPFTELIQLSQWIEAVGRRLQAAQIELEVFDPLTIEPVRLAQLRALAPTIRAGLEALAQFTDVQEREFPRARAFAQIPPGESWKYRVDVAQQLVTNISVSYSKLSVCLETRTLLANNILPIVTANYRLPSAIEELKTHEAGEALLERHFAGAATDIEPVIAAFTYGRQIKKAKLPRVVEAVLISEASPRNHSRLVQLIKIIQDGWEAAADFSRQLAEFGQFRLDQWVDASSLPHSEYAHHLLEKTQTASASLDNLQDWSHYVALRKEALSENLDAFVSLLESRELPSKALQDAYAYRFYGSIGDSLFRRFPQFGRFNGLRHSTVRAEFAELDKQIIKLRGQQISLKCIAQARPPAGNMGFRVGDKTEMVLLDYLISLTLPRTPVRQILKRAGRAVQELKPCFMMGPQAVAQFLEPGQLEFDIVVMDEASQLKPEEAIGAIARGKQLVVVGDPKQLPPTAFFARQNQLADGDDSGQQTAAEDAESILDVCMGHFHPVRTLRWHYRSRHESLIAFSNHYFYKSNLFVFPSPYPKGKVLGLHYVFVPNGIYENQMNKTEALRVIDAVVEHIRSRPDDSLGVVTLNVKQRDLIAELWEERRKSVSQAEEFERRWEIEGTGLFFKNLENVQGDERDCILISTTFGKVQAANAVRQNFGPISRQGGWRRLNVLFTRARKSIGLITSMQPEDIIEDGHTPEGTKALRNYLEYARSGILPQQNLTSLEPDSDFEIAVINLIESWGYSVTPQLGVAGFRIDIAVKHPRYPSAYLAAVECDGATYHSAQSVRDRDRIRQEILEGLGWKGKIWRIWSSDWFRSPLSEAKKLNAFLESLKDNPIPAEFVVETEARSTDADRKEPEISVPPSLDEQNVSIDILDEDEEELEVEIGDLVTYCPTDSSTADPITARITQNHNDFNQGLVSSHTPLGQVLIGATVGETVVLRVPGQAGKKFIIKQIKRLNTMMAN